MSLCRIKYTARILSKLGGTLRETGGGATTMSPGAAGPLILSLSALLHISFFLGPRPCPAQTPSHLVLGSGWVPVPPPGVHTTCHGCFKYLPFLLGSMCPTCVARLSFLVPLPNLCFYVFFPWIYTFTAERLKTTDKHTRHKCPAQRVSITNLVSSSLLCMCTVFL